MIRLEKLLIRKLGNIAPNTELHFGKRGALLLGKNGTGKTTLLNVIVAALKTDWGALEEMGNDGFDLTFEIVVHPKEAPEIRITTSMSAERAAQQPIPEISFISRNEPLSRQLETLILSEGNLTFSLSSKDGESTLNYPTGTSETIKPARSSLLEILLFGLDNHKSLGPHRSAYLMLIGEVHARLRRYDEALEHFHLLTAQNSNVFTATLFPANETLIVSGSEFISRPTGEAFKKSFKIPGAAKRSVPEYLQIEVENLSLADKSEASGTNWLRDFCYLCSFDSASISLDLVETRKDDNIIIAYYGSLSLRYTKIHHTLTHHRLSFGQKRLFSTLAYLDTNKFIAVADELVNGMHYEWIERCFTLLQEKQSFLSSQNPILFDFMNFSSAEDASNQFVECELNEKGEFVWRNMAIDDATDFYEIYQTGIQHVSEILRTRGYW